MNNRSSSWVTKAIAMLGIGIVACSHPTAATAQVYEDPMMGVIDGISTPGQIMEAGTIPSGWPYSTSGYTGPAWADPGNLINVSGLGPVALLPDAGIITVMGGRTYLLGVASCDGGPTYVLVPTSEADPVLGPVNGMPTVDAIIQMGTPSQ